MSSTPRLVLSSSCSCTCRAVNSTSTRRSISNTTTTATATRSASTSSASTHRLQPRQRWLMPDFQARKRVADLPPPKARKFENKLNLPDGSVTSIYTTSPRPNIAITKDTTNHPLWAFTSDIGGAGSGMQQEDEGGRLGRFARKFGAAPPAPASSPQATTSAVLESDKTAAKASKSEDAPSTTVDKDAKKESENKTTPAPTPAEVKTKETKTTESKDNDMDFFDLALEGEEVEVTGHKVVEESGGKKGKKAASGGKKK